VEELVRLLRAPLPPDGPGTNERRVLRQRVLDAAYLARLAPHLEVAAALHVTEEVPAKARLELADTGPVPAHAPRRVLLRALAQEPKLEERRLLLGERLHEAHDQRVHFEVFDALVRRAALVLADNGALREHPALERRQLLRRRIAHERLADRDLPPARREIG